MAIYSSQEFSVFSPEHVLTTAQGKVSPGRAETSLPYFPTAASAQSHFFRAFFHLALGYHLFEAGNPRVSLHTLGQKAKELFDKLSPLPKAATLNPVKRVTAAAELAGGGALAGRQPIASWRLLSQAQELKHGFEFWQRVPEAPHAPASRGQQTPYNHACHPIWEEALHQLREQAGKERDVHSNWQLPFVSRWQLPARGRQGKGKTHQSNMLDAKHITR